MQTLEPATRTEHSAPWPWQHRLPRALRLSDGGVIAVSMALAQVLRFGTDSSVTLKGSAGLNYWLVTALIIFAWWIMLEAWGTRDLKVLGTGPEEYKRVAVASLYLFGVIAIFSYALDIPTARGYVGAALPAGVLMLMCTRWLIRRWLVGQRANGQMSRRLLLIGGPSAVAHLHKNLSSNPAAGYLPVAAILPGFLPQSPTGEELPIPVAGVSADLEHILSSIEEHQADAIAISSGSALKPRTIRSLGWELQERGISMIMAPALTDIAGPRIHTQPIAGLPLIHVSTPKLEGMRAVFKRAFDILGASIVLLLLSPVLLATATMVKRDSPGPAFFHQFRVGKNGETFRMHKFRSMVVDAETRLDALQADNEGNGVLFKMKEDPRITRFGAFIRRYSIDELPQLWNVLMGEMSMVGPRPPLPAEVDTYEKYVHRRLMVKPGITGLWQVSGRSDLSWEDSVRLDLYYVENWSLMQDLVILARTVKAVLAKDGAY
ncbi:polyprenyl glycosylphosphotransferase [Zafaria cholistanensis]|uniref:Polyprenyl glycosylphosphotransferase n=1 Tax=Zafaria cholistanensis TaxID=1682741 RepID=A0A5A7NPL2_9MICC|nr:sugar transferase [Zafaria cholistanensis]GER21691.1 polyprenyl glycosylphosphotransferase [Zafaria cholistanensis]